MKEMGPLAEIVRFGTFQLDPKARELHKAGVKVRLQDQPFRVLALLVNRAGQVVTREELRQEIWPTDVYVAFDQGLNNAIRKVRDSLGDSADNPRFVETIAKQGYRFLAPVSVVQTQPSEQPLQQGLRSSRVAVLAGVVAAGGLLTLGYWAWHASDVRARPPTEKVILAVLPFDNLSRDPEQEFFSDGLTEEMIAQLGKVNPERLSVIARGSVVKYKGSALAVEQIGRDLHAEYLVQGSVRRSSNQVRITVQLVQVGDQTNLWAESYDAELKNILELQSSVARTIAKQIHIKLSAKQQLQLTRTRQVDPAAYDAYLRGRYYWNKRSAEGMQKAAGHFQEAIDKDSAYGAAYSGLADCSSGLAWHGFASPSEALTKANTAALKAIEIDPQSAEAHASLALVLSHRLDWPAAEAEFKRALQLDPNYANAHHWYGDYLSIKGRHDEALLEAKRALELDPLNLMIGAWVSWRYYLAHEYDRAIQQGRDTVDLDSSFAAAHLLLGKSYLQSGLHKEGIAELQRAANLSGNSPLYLAQVAVAYGVAGKKTEALRTVAQLQELSRQRYVSPYGIAQAYAALNDREQTFKWLQVAYEDHAVWMSYLAVDPLFDRFHSDSRFQELLQRVGLLPSKP
jgi:TolB-like protein/DNA-binding winged helix-turn-helix (wHTH) protein/Flp pilus assembly protein TadD